MLPSATASHEMKAGGSAPHPPYLRPVVAQETPDELVLREKAGG